MKKFVLIAGCTFAICSCLKEEDRFLPYSGMTPIEINDHWVISSPEAENMDRQALESIFRGIHRTGEPWQMRSLLVIRNGRLVAETYLKDRDDIRNPQPIWSCTKQVMGMLTGIAVHQGYIDSLSDPISKYLDLQNHPDKKDITIENLLTMHSGIAFDEKEDVSTLLQRSQGNTIDYILGLPLLFPPGQAFNYNSGDPHLISACIQNSLGRPLDEWAYEELFSKVHFENYSWLEFDGYNFGGFGLTTTPRELGKLAALVENQGYWNGEQLIDSAWVREMVSFKTSTHSAELDFGYQWWISKSMDLYFMSGSGGQYACIVPDKDLIVISFAEQDTDDDLELGFEVVLEIVKDVIQASN